MFDSVSLLIAHGHADAAEYPLWYVHAQAEMVQYRVNQDTKTKTTLMTMALVAAGAQSEKAAKKAFKALSKALENL